MDNIVYKMQGNKDLLTDNSFKKVLILCPNECSDCDRESIKRFMSKIGKNKKITFVVRNTVGIFEKIICKALQENHNVIIVTEQPIGALDLKVDLVPLLDPSRYLIISTFGITTKYADISFWLRSFEKARTISDTVLLVGSEDVDKNVQGAVKSLIDNKEVFVLDTNPYDQGISFVKECGAKIFE